MLVALLLLSSARVHAQSSDAISYATIVAAEESLPEQEFVPLLKGPNLTVAWTPQHNSSTGWAEIVTPAVSYRFDRHFSVNAAVPWYVSMQAYKLTTVRGADSYPLTIGRNLIGDTTLAGHFENSRGDLGYMLTSTVGFDTGAYDFGLSADSPTFNFTNHFDYSLGRFTPDLEIGIGDSSTLSAREVRRNYTAVGPLANFQAGGLIELPWRLGLDLEAYEQLPIGDQRVYGTVTSRNKAGKILVTQVLEGRSITEDNGFNAEFEIPLGHVVVVSGYTRSLIQHLDTASIGLTWTWRIPRRATPAWQP